MSIRLWRNAAGRTPVFGAHSGSRSRSRSRGQDVVEFALIFPPQNIGGCSNSKPFLQDEIGPPSNSYGCCTQVGIAGPDRIGTPSGPGTFQNLGVQLVR